MQTVNPMDLGRSDFTCFIVLNYVQVATLQTLLNVTSTNDADLAFALGTNASDTLKFTIQGVPVGFSSISTGAHVITLTRDIVAPLITAQIDTGTATTFAAGGSDAVGDEWGMDFTIGSNVDQIAEPWLSDIGDVIFYDRVLTAGEITSMQDFLFDKWAIGPSFSDGFDDGFG